MKGLISPQILAALQANGQIPASDVQQDPQPQGLLGRIGGRMFGPDINSEQRRGLLGQALLSMGSGMAQTGGQGFMGALGNGIQSGLLAMNQGRDSINDAVYKRALMDRQDGEPAGLREFNAMTDGLSDEEKAQARRVRLGIEGRASSAGIGFGEWVDANGVPRPKRENPRSGVLEVFYEEEGRWVPIGSGPGNERPTAPSPPPAFATPPYGGIGSDVVPIYEALRPAVERAESGGNPNAVSSAGAMGRMQVMPGTARDPGFGIQPARDNSDAELTRTGEQYLQAMLSRYSDPRAALAAYNWGPGNVDKALQTAGGDVDAMLRNAPAETRAYVPRVLGYAQASVPTGLGRGRSKEAEAAAVAGATRAVELGTLPTELGMRADSAVDQAGRIAATTGAIDLQNEQTKAAASRARDANTAIGLLDEAERVLPTATGSTAGAAADRAAALFGRSTSGAQSTAQLKTIAGQLVSRMPRMEGPQSDKDVQLYKDMAGNLADDTLPVATRQAAAQQIRRLQEKYANPQPAAASRAPAQGPPRRLRYNPATGSLE